MSFIVTLQSNDKAQNNLGNRYRKGQGVEQDYKQAFFWYKKASLQSNDKAQNNLGNMYRKGQGVERDMNKAVYWIKKAKKQNNHSATKNWDKHKLWKYENRGEGINTQAIPTIEEAIKDYEEKNYKFAFARFYAFAKAGNPIAQWYLSMMYIRGDGVIEDKKKGFEWMSKSAEQGDLDAQYQLGRMYALGEGVNKDPKQAFIWMSKSAEQGVADAQFSLAGMYLNGEGVREDTDKALELIIKAAEQGHKEAKEFLDELRKEKESLICLGGVGTGFVVSQDGVIATAEHVVTSKNGKGVECGCKKIEVDGLEASIIAKDEATDTAIIKINKTYEDVASLSDRPLVQLEDIVVIGWPQGHRYFQNFISSTPGNVSGMAGYMDDITEFRHTAPSHQGNSGGPVVALSDGKVVGIVSSGLNAKPGERVEFQNLNFAKRISILREMMNAKRIPITSKKILPRNKLIEHYEDKVTKFIKCIN